MEAKQNAGSVVVLVSGAVQALLDKWKGEVDVVRIDAQAQPSTTRYVDVFITFDGRAAATWCGRDEHTFDMLTGRCVESSDGRMKGWRIAPWEMHRFNPADAAKYLDGQASGGMSVGTGASEKNEHDALNSIQDPFYGSFTREERHAAELHANSVCSEFITNEDRLAFYRTRDAYLHGLRAARQG